MIDDRIYERAATKTAKEEQENEEAEGEFRKKKHLAFLDLLLEAYDNEEISREGVREEVDTFTFEVSKKMMMNVMMMTTTITIRNMYLFPRKCYKYPALVAITAIIQMLRSLEASVLVSMLIFVPLP